jgi:hypothetical protein
LFRKHTLVGCGILVFICIISGLIGFFALDGDERADSSQVTEAAQVDAALTATNTPLPTLVSTEPSPTPRPTATPVMQTSTPATGPFSSIEQLTTSIVGHRLADHFIKIDEDGFGYDVTIAIANPHNLSRLELLRLAYDLQRAFHYDFPSNTEPAMYLHLRPDSLGERCVLDVGIGHEAAPEFLPRQTPNKLPNWFSTLAGSHYYANRPGDKASLLAYAFDPAERQNCDGFPEWQR